METLADQWMEQGAQKERHRAEEWIKQEKDKWERQAELKATRENLIKSLKMRFEIVQPDIKNRIRSLESLDTVNDLFELSFKCSSLDEFANYLNKLSKE